MKILEIKIEPLSRGQHVGLAVSHWKNTLKVNHWQFLVGNIFNTWSDIVEEVLFSPESEEPQRRQTFIQQRWKLWFYGCELFLSLKENRSSCWKMSPWVIGVGE